jgi:competence protein ComEA
MGEGLNRALFVGVIAVVAVSLGVGAGLMRRPSPTPAPLTGSSTTSPSEMIDVHVAGWVLAPGVVSVEAGSIVADAVAAAGGMRAGAETNSINLAAEVYPGEQVIVPGPTREVSPGGIDAPGQPISLNRADTSSLEELPGVGPVLAERIVSFREQNGRFESVEELLEVPGIGEAKLASIRDLVRP